MIENHFLLRLNWIMEWGRGSVKFGADRLCPKCNREEQAASKATREEGRMTAFDEHREELERYEQMFGRDRGRLAVSLDRITNALVLVGQHGVYCTSQRNPALPSMDLRMISHELTNAKELIQSVMAEIRKARLGA
jgi:ssDNA-binding Zn-finger/Zn-ribbon topoisomerase 1